ncbi:unnamed protein product [Rotaria sp. Silwood2]|nr:unnamed protein product [Rotaria sp. Silwood2]CAF4000055.1 unnamed protein product [Rotaria sp. Silwood2]
MYETSGSGYAFDCLQYWRVASNMFEPSCVNRQSMSYCRRPKKNSVEDPFSVDNKIIFNGQLFTFDDLPLQCSSSACISACQNQYPGVCPSIVDLGQTNGVCISQSGGNTRCQCQCCGTNGCPTCEINTNENCASCSTLCQQQSICGNTNTVTHSCNTNQSKRSVEFSLESIF